MHTAGASQAEAVGYGPEMFSSREGNRVTSSDFRTPPGSATADLASILPLNMPLLQHITFPALGCSSKVYTFIFILSLIRSCLLSVHYNYNTEIFFINTTLTPLLVL